MKPHPPSEPGVEPEKVRPHVFDGIQEYDNKMPNWWLNTLYATVIFSIVYWFAFRHSSVVAPDGEAVDREMTKIAAAKMATSIDVSNDELFWQMSRNENFISSGKQTYASMCAACHLPNLKGKTDNPGAVGPDLTDLAWLHGGTPKDIYKTVAAGVLAKGMPAWEPVLGQKKTAEVVAYLLSHHEKGE